MKAFRTAGLAWGGAVLAALCWGLGLLWLSPARSEFGALPLYLLGLPWTAMAAETIRKLSPGPAVSQGMLACCGLVTAGVLFWIGNVKRGAEDADKTKLE